LTTRTIRSNNDKTNTHTHGHTHTHTQTYTHTHAHTHTHTIALTTKTTNKLQGLVSDVLHRLGIAKWRSDRVGRGSDTSKSHISGGQKKRVNIGIEIVADPGLLFLDEPTSGLDSATTQKIITELRNLAVNASLPIAAVLHQPRCV
jgi:ABC-type multidrug transport system ATPase subunit